MGHVKINLRSFETIPKPLFVVVFEIWPETMTKTFIIRGFLAILSKKYTKIASKLIQNFLKRPLGHVKII